MWGSESSVFLDAFAITVRFLCKQKIMMKKKNKRQIVLITIFGNISTRSHIMWEL
jgi:hypothetical protein